MPSQQGNNNQNSINHGKKQSFTSVCWTKRSSFFLFCLVAIYVANFIFLLRNNSDSSGHSGRLSLNDEKEGAASMISKEAPTRKRMIDERNPAKQETTRQEDALTLQTSAKSTSSNNVHEDAGRAGVQSKATSRLVNSNITTETSRGVEASQKSANIRPPPLFSWYNNKTIRNTGPSVRLGNHLRYDNVTLQVPTPIFLASLPKSGTTSVWKYFLCGGVNASHFYVKLNAKESQRFLSDKDKRMNHTLNSTFAGRCMHANVLQGKPLLENCGNYQVWTDTGYIKGKPAIQCYYPAIEGLDEFYRWYPNATLMYITRNTHAWTQSVSIWSMGTLLKRWKRCHLTGLINTTKVGMNAFYEWHKELVRDFARKHPSLTYIEAALEDRQTGFFLQDATGIPASCWADCNPQTRQCSTVKH